MRRQSLVTAAPPGQALDEPLLHLCTVSFIQYERGNEMTSAREIGCTKESAQVAPSRHCRNTPSTHIDPLGRWRTTTSRSNTLRH